MKSWIFRIVMGAMIIGTGYVVGLNDGFDAGYIKGVAAEFDAKESAAVQGCEVVLSQCSRDKLWWQRNSQAWHRRAENCQEHLRKLIRLP